MIPPITKVWSIALQRKSDKKLYSFAHVVVAGVWSDLRKFLAKDSDLDMSQPLMWTLQSPEFKKLYRLGQLTNTQITWLHQDENEAPLPMGD